MTPLLWERHQPHQRRPLEALQAQLLCTNKLAVSCYDLVFAQGEQFGSRTCRQQEGGLLFDWEPRFDFVSYLKVWADKVCLWYASV